MDINENGAMESPDNLVILLQTNKGQLEIPMLSGDEPGGAELDPSFVTILQEGSDPNQLLYVTCLMDPAELAADALAPDALVPETFLAPDSGLQPDPDPDPDPEPAFQEPDPALLTAAPGRALAQIHGGLRIEERLQVLEALLPPPEPRAAPNSAAPGQPLTCSVCDASFARPAQLRLHCLRRHGPSVGAEEALERRPHTCSLCPARFDRASQLGYHERRVHAGERAHCCQICRKSFFKRSDLITHLRIHLGIQCSVCETCGRRFSHVSNLIRHARIHSGVRPYPCSQCGRRFSQISAMLQHRASHEPGSSCLCPVCSRGFRSQATLRRHMRALHPSAAFPPATAQDQLGPRVRRFYCRVCGDSFELAALVRAHERAHEQDGSLRCRACDRPCDSLADLKTHSCRPEEDPDSPDPKPASPATPEPQPPATEAPPAAAVPAPAELVIYVAQEGWAQPAAVHVRALLGDAADAVHPASPAGPTGTGTPSGLTGLPPLIGPISPAGPTAAATPSSLPSLPSLAAGPIDSADPDTEMDPLGLSDPADLTDPTLLVDPTEALGLPSAVSSADCAGPGGTLVIVDPQDIVDEGEDTDPDSRKKTGVFKCPECPKRFRKNSNLKQHLGVHSVEQMRYRCAVCGHPFAWKSTLNKHLLRVHGSGAAGTPLAGCELCSRSYRSTAQLQEHVRRDHRLERPHACPAPGCQRRFYKKHDLKVHQRTHTQERPYICGWCGKSFYHQSHIIRHERIHSGSRPYSCEDCGRCFNQSSSLKTHRRRHQTSGAPPVMVLMPVPTQ